MMGYISNQIQYQIRTKHEENKKKKQKQNRLRNTKTLNKSSPEIKVPIEYLLIPGRTVVEPIGGENGMLKEMEAEEKVRNLKENYGLYIARD
jgi:hypothetical protein